MRNLRLSLLSAVAVNVLVVISTLDTETKESYFDNHIEKLYFKKEDRMMYHIHNKN